MVHLQTNSYLADDRNRNKCRQQHNNCWNWVFPFSHQDDVQKMPYQQNRKCQNREKGVVDQSAKVIWHMIWIKSRINKPCQISIFFHFSQDFPLNDTLEGGLQPSRATNIISSFQRCSLRIIGIIIKLNSIQIVMRTNLFSTKLNPSILRLFCL